MKTKEKLTPLKAVRKAVQLLGGQRAAARNLGVSQHTLWKAVNNKLVHGVSPGVAVMLHIATKGKVKKSDLRPDVYTPRGTRKAA